MSPNLQVFILGCARSGTSITYYAMREVFDDALAGRKHLVCYSVKANSNLAVLRSLIAMGAGVDTVSRGEIFRELKAGVDPQKIVFSDVGHVPEQFRELAERKPRRDSSAPPR